ncbi:hypothetical protein EYF80_062888 [Liparis tanakae]|uniref:Uncharacterized protein n=1 Tax=Liparis tanakae TaxID=230148 RepID=A0A4Z2EDP3_9TELE|nr:hypothetical protein EYF80_062888 [Liparis tanakae]
MPYAASSGSGASEAFGAAAGAGRLLRAVELHAASTRSAQLDSGVTLVLIKGREGTAEPCSRSAPGDTHMCDTFHMNIWKLNEDLTLNADLSSTWTSAQRGPQLNEDLSSTRTSAQRGPQLNEDLSSTRTSAQRGPQLNADLPAWNQLLLQRNVLETQGRLLTGDQISLLQKRNWCA